MEINRKDIGYTIYSRLEESLRFLISNKLLNLYGDDWRSYIPKGIWEKVLEKSNYLSKEDFEEPIILFEEIDIPDLTEILSFKKSFTKFIPQFDKKFSNFKEIMSKLYNIRCKIAHVRTTFSAIDLDLLIELTNNILPFLDKYGNSLREVLEYINKNPERVIIKIPQHFYINDDQLCSFHKTNLPPADYDPDGGFIGRKEDLNAITKLITGELHRVITISGAGGVGKSAIAHKICQNFLNKKDLKFDAIIWVSAKEEKLTVTGIEPIEPSLRNYESVLDNIIQTYGWLEDLNTPIEQKEEDVDLILQGGDKGILLVIDNLETIQDERVKEFIKDFPPPSKVIITSRIGLGEVERRYPLKEMNNLDAITLIRTVAREKKTIGLANLPDDILSKYVDKMSRYPLAIKWVVGQVALGKDINIAIGNLTSPKGDVAKFCFENIFDNLLTENAKMILYSLAASDKPLVRGVLSHVSNLSNDDLDIALRDLTIASLVIQTQFQTQDSTIETNYELLPLTKNYIQSKLQSHPEIHRTIKGRIEVVRNLIEEADRAGRQYRYSLRDMGAESEAEKVAATWAITAYQKFQAEDYDGAVEFFNKAVEIAPNFPAIYRNWATMESNAGFYGKADELMEKATKLNPNDSRLWFVWGNIEKRRQRYDRAFEFLSKALKLSPNDSPILGSLGEVEKRRGNFENADDFLNKALKGNSTVPSRRHEIICFTAIADNLRRWANLLIHERFEEEAINKLKKSYDYALKAYNMSKDDIRSENAFLESSQDLAIQLLTLEGINSSIKYFINAITLKPKRAKEKKINEVCCLFLAEALLDSGRIIEAKKYYSIGRKSLFPDSKYTEKYKQLSVEFSQDRSVGVLSHIKESYGFLELDGEIGQTIFLHYTNITPKITKEDFSSMKGTKFSFIVEKNDKGISAKRARIIRN